MKWMGVGKVVNGVVARVEGGEGVSGGKKWKGGEPGEGRCGTGGGSGGTICSPIVKLPRGLSSE